VSFSSLIHYQPPGTHSTKLTHDWEVMYMTYAGCGNTKRYRRIE